MSKFNTYAENRVRLGQLINETAPTIMRYAALCVEERTELGDTMMEFLELAFEQGRVYQLRRFGLANPGPSYNPYERPTHD